MTTQTYMHDIEETAAPFTGGVRGTPKALLRLEGLAAMALAALAFARVGGSWPMFAVLFLAPDLSTLGYLAGRRFGAAAYNAAHSYLGPAVVGAFGVALSSPIAVQVALIWVAHVGFDRALGYGLKYPTAFGDTHLGRIGKAKRS
jgi:hypothetical protein